MKTKLLLMLLAVVLTAGLAQANMIANPSFEDGEYDRLNTNPANWENYWGMLAHTTASGLTVGQHSWVDDTASAHSGSKHLRLKNWSHGAVGTGVVQSGIVVQEGKEYAFSVWAKRSTTGLSPQDETDVDTKAEAWGQWFEPNNVPFGDEFQLGLPTTVGAFWQLVDFNSLTPPAGAGKCSVTLWSVEGNLNNRVRYDDVDMRIISATNPDPSGGQRFKDAYPPGSEATGKEVILSWTNMEPNSIDGDGDVYVDVWFGYEPNNITTAGWNKVVDANGVTAPTGLNATSVIVNAPTLLGPDPTPYYWKVISYPSGAAYIDPNNKLETRLWEFTALSEIPATVVIDTNDMVTWEGRSVSLNTSITDDGDSTVTYLWEATDTGVTFDPNEFVKNPAVIITGGTYPAASIVNHSFEDSLNGWDHINNEGYVGTWDGGIYITPTDGYEVAYMDSNSAEPNDVGISQTLAESFAADTDYTLTVDVVNDGYYNEDFVHYKIQFLAGEYVLREKTGSISLFNYPGVWIPESIVYDNYTAAADANKIDLPLGIRLFATTDSNEVCYDNVVLTADPPFEALPGHAYTITVTATDAVDYPSFDTMTIKNYETPCQAGRIGLDLGAQNRGDIVGDPGDPDPAEPDCDTDIYDIAAMVKTWLDETELTAPIAKPY